MKKKKTNRPSDGETPALVPGGYFPDDLDTTSLALQIIPPSDSERVSSLLEKMADYVNDDGTFQVRYPPTHIVTWQPQPRPAEH